ncbi:bromodomain-containing protein 4 [Neocloeon triangulifer]|uniref:bromodomain-containing protein 4 n=1 Tax=Neocloeon triangulifer TaxID=2078957 RepID=UPI00286EFCE8|nr:bromodomain-containing protein 4 [Neocloeon triangulifer]
MRSKTVRSSRVPPPKNSQSPLVILSNKKKPAAAKPNATHKTRAQPKLGRSQAPSGEKPKGKLKKMDVAKSLDKKAAPDALEKKSNMEPSNPQPPAKQQPKGKTTKTAPPPKTTPKKVPKPRKGTAPPAKKLPSKNVRAPKATPPAARGPKKKEPKTPAKKEPKPSGVDEPLLLKDGRVRKRAPYKKRVKPEPASVELSDSAIAKILSKTKEPRGTKDKKVPQIKEEKKPKAAAKVVKADESKKATVAAAKAKEVEEKKLKSLAKLLSCSAAVVKEAKKEPEVKKVEPVLKEAKKQPVSKAMNPPKKRAMAPLKKRLVARAAIDEAALIAQAAALPEKKETKKAAGTKVTVKAPPLPAKKGGKKSDVSSSSPSSPEAPKGKKRESKQAKSIAQKMLPPKKRNLHALQVTKPKAKKAAGRRESSSSSEDEKPLDVFRFWGEPKKHRVASLNALAKVHCMYENEASRPVENHQVATTTTSTTRSSVSRTTKSSQWYDSSTESSTSGSESNSGALVPYRRGAKPAKKTKKKQSKRVEPEEEDEESSPAPSPPPKQTKRKKKKSDMLMDLKDMVVRKRMASLNASAMLAASYSFEKRSPNKNCTTTVEVVEVKQQTSTSIDKKEDGDTVSTSSINMVRVRKNKILAKKKAKEAKSRADKKRKMKDESTTDDASADDPDDDIPLSNVIKLRNPKKVALIVNDTDVTITGVYVNSRTTEGYCISGMEYRISSTQTKSTTVVQPPSQVAAASPGSEYVAQQHHHLHHHHHHHNPAATSEPGVYHAAGGEREPATVFLKPAPPQSYTPLGALSSMQPPASLQQGPPPHHPPGPPPPMGVHHQPPLGSSGSAFSAPISSCTGPPPTHDQPHYLQGYYQPAGPLIHAGAEMCCAPPKIVPNHSAAPNSAVSPLLIATSSAATSSAAAAEVTSTSSTLPSRIVSSQVSPFSTYQPQYAPHYIAHYSAPPQYASPQYYHPQANHQLVAASHHLAPPHHEICAYPPCYGPPPHYKYQPQTYHPRYAPPAQHFFPHASGTIYSAPPTASTSNQSMHLQSMPSTSGAKLQAPSTSATPTTIYHPPPPPVITQHPPEPPHYHFYTGYSPGGPVGPCLPHPATRGVAYLDSTYQTTCPCPMQSCPKNVHTGPLTGDSKGPGPQESLFVLPTVAAAALPGEALAPGHPPSPARGSSGGPAAAHGPSPSVEEEQITPPAWVAAEPTPPPSDDSSAPRGSYFYDQVDNNTTDVNQNYNCKRKHTSSSTITSTPLASKRSKLMENNNLNLNEPLLITTTMLADANKVGQFDNLSAKLHSKGGTPQMGILPLTPPTSSDTSPSISSTGSSSKTKHSKQPAEKAKKVQRQLNTLSPSEKDSPTKLEFEMLSRSLDSSEIENTGTKFKNSCLVNGSPILEQSDPPEEEKMEKLEVSKKVRKRSGQNVAPKKSKKATLAAEKEAEELAHNDLMTKVSLRKSFAPKWSNGWSWEGEPYQAKVFLRSDDPPVLRYCYPAMRHEEGDIIMPRDCILLKSGTRKGDLPYVAKVTALWENPEDGEMMLSLLWFYRPEHTEQGRLPNHMADEIFASKHKDSSSVACIEDKCYVLTFNEYCRYRAKAKQIEVGVSSRTSIVPQQSQDDVSAQRRIRQPACLAAPELVFFCRRVYDFRCKRMLKNPGA